MTGPAAELAVEALRAAVAAVDPAIAVRRRLAALRPPPPVTVLALGKAAPGMARAAAQELGSDLGEAVVVSDHEEPLPPGMRLLLGGHPAPDPRSVAAGDALLAGAARARGSLLVLLSGGGSALAEAPAPGLAVEDLARVTEALLGRGVPIEEVNTVRRHLSRLKDGGLLRVSPAPVVTLILSDVVDGPASAVASGPTLADGTSPADALAVLDRHRALAAVPPQVVEALRRPIDAAAPSPPHRWEVVGDCRVAAEAAAAHLRSRAGGAVVTDPALRGDAAERARRFVGGLETGVWHVAAGETTVEVRGEGRGGRNQHAALVAAVAFEGDEFVFAALGTDGRDGPTDAAGAVVDGGTAGRVRAAGLDPERMLTRYDSHPALEAAGALVRTGPTGTNVADLWLGTRGTGAASPTVGQRSVVTSTGPGRSSRGGVTVTSTTVDEVPPGQRPGR